MKTRILVAAIGLPLLLVVVLALPSVATAILLSAMCVIGCYELFYGTGLCRHIRILIYSALSAVLICFWGWLGLPRTIGQLGVLLYLAALFCEMLAAHTNLKFSTVCVAIFGGLVFPYLLSALVRLRVMDNGAFYILVAFVLTMVPDSGAYFAGMALGKHKLAPIISPKKTVEGVVGGVLATVLAMVLYGLVLQFAFKFTVNYVFAVIYGILGAAGSVLGDLTFSVIKRQTKIKDYGNLIPGHGGMFDRADSLLFSIPTTYLCLYLARPLFG